MGDRQLLERSGIWQDRVLERFMVEAAWAVPDQVTLAGSEADPLIVWRHEGEVGQGPVADWHLTSRDTDAKILWDFVKLCSTPDDKAGWAVHRYAETHGVLELCRELGVPRFWCPESTDPVTREGHGHMDPFRGEERVADWLMWSRLARAVLRVSAAQEMKSKGDLSDWVTLWTEIPARLQGEGASPLGLLITNQLALSCQRSQIVSGDLEDWFKAQRRATLGRELEFWVNLWLAVGDVSWRFRRVDPPEPRLQLHARTTFGAIARQLAGAVAKSKGLRICSCAAPFVPARGNQKYCQKCKRDRVPEKHRKRKQRAKKK